MTRLILWAYSLLAGLFALGVDCADIVSQIYPNWGYAVDIQESDCDRGASPRGRRRRCGLPLLAGLRRLWRLLGCPRIRTSKCPGGEKPTRRFPRLPGRGLRR